MKINNKFIKDQFGKIIEKYELDFFSDEEYVVKIENERVEIYFCTERWEDGIITAFRNKIKNEFYYPSKVEEIKGFSDFKEFLTPEETIYIDSLQEGNDMIVYSFRILLERYCQDMLSGDFSKVPAGTPS
ncbi:hypothetical protein [uncultured Aquimarina sp.]|uniref:hypothetical protein n=1 Tax=uncultured Aquimarina sp. TaxID=575652 RepID=UPI00263A3BD7|nr:hypothetical protein [uncultured Aquimarina sp.]